MALTRPVSTIAAAAWTLLVVVSLTLPGSSLPQTGALQYDKAVHALLFGVGVFLWLRIPWKSATIRWIIVLGALALAPLSELGQELMGNGRQADPIDAFADIVGVTLGAGAWLLIRKKRSGRGSSPDEPTHP